MASKSSRSVRLVPGGLLIGDETVPLYSGTIHYFRLDPADWRACLAATKALGVRLVDVYVPWDVHEVSAGVFDFGERDPRRDVAQFLRLAHEMGLYAIVRPGPHINAEMTCFGIPERVIWDPPCQARSPRGNPVILPMLPFGFPVPSYASDAFFDEVARYFHALGPVLSPLLYPDGPIVLLQVDNEGAFYFRDGLYDQDYHPDAVRHYRARLRDKYKTVQGLPTAYLDLLARSADKARDTSARDPDSVETTLPSGPGTPTFDLRFSSLDPPARFNAQTLDEVVVHLDWAEAQEDLLVAAFTRFRGALEHAGLAGLPTMHNLPPGEDCTPLSATAVLGAVDLVGLDYYYPAGQSGRAIVARRTGELAALCESRAIPPFACEMGAGFPPFFPPLDEHDNAFTILTALAFGLRGMNLYMAVERDRWIGAPIDRRGRPRPFAAFFKKLFAALEATRFHALRRRVPVRLVLPRSERRLARALHAFGPVPGMAFSIMNRGARERCIEDDLGTGAPIGILADTFLRAFEQALDSRGVPFAIVEALDGDAPLDGASWVVCVTSGGLSPALFDRLAKAHEQGAAITIGPEEPRRDASFQRRTAPFDWDLLTRHTPPPATADSPPPDSPAPSAHSASPDSAARDSAARDSASRASAPRDLVPLFVDDVPASADNAVSRAIESLGLPTFACDPHGVLATVHEDADGHPRALFLLNPTDSDLVVRASLGPTPVKQAHDLFDDERIPVIHGAVEARVPPKTVRMFSLE